MATPLTPAQQQLVLDNLILTNMILKRYKYGWWYGFLDRADAEQVCNETLVKAASKYDPSTGATFTTYATHAMLKEIRRAANKQHFFGNNKQLNGERLPRPKYGSLKNSHKGILDRFAADNVDLLETLMGHLDDRSRQVIEAIFFEGASVSEIADRFAEPPVVVKRLKKAALAKMAAVA